MVDGGLGISAAVAIGSKFIERSKFSLRHSVSYDQEVEKNLKTAERFEKIPKEDVDYFEAEEYNLLHSKCVDAGVLPIETLTLLRYQVSRRFDHISKRSGRIQEDGVVQRTEEKN